MNASLRALLAGSIDYAGMFPPAGLTLTEAIDRYRQYRGSQASWMLGRFVVPAAQNHPLTEELLDAATITEETAARDQYRSVLHRYLGTKDGGTGRKASSHAPASDLAS